ncbi:MAG: DUF3857 domain-containing protein [Bacteroidales bacterium]|nr:DUF3857 domain-containing protein [Bacteroidales bacterium]
MYKIILTFLLLGVGISLTQAQPESDARYDKIVKEYTLFDDGSVDFHYYKKLTLLTHYSFNRLYGETFIVYNPQSQELNINYCRTTHKDGKVTEAPFNAYNEVLPRFAAGSPPYNHLREMVVTHPGTEIGAVLELDYNLKSEPGYFPGLMADELLPQDSPVLEEEIIIKVPKGSELHYKVLNLRTAPEISEEGDFTTYTFVFKGLKETSHESHLPADHAYLPRLIFSTLTWKEALDWLYQQPMWQLKANQEMQEEVAAIRKENKYDLPFIAKVNKMVTEQVNNWLIPWEYAGYAGRIPSKSWESNGGTAFEKSLLMVALLRESTVHAVPVLSLSSKLYDENIGCLPLVSDFLVQVNPRELEQMYVSPIKSSDQNLIYHLSGNTLIALDPKQTRVEAVNERFENKVVTNGTLTLDDSLKLKGNIGIMMTEAANPYYEIESDSSYVKGLLSGIDKKSIVSSKLINDAQFRSLAELTIETNKPAQNYGGYHFLELPFNKKGTEGWHLNYLKSNREVPLELAYPVNEQYSYEFTIQGKYTLVNPVELTEIKNSAGELVLSTEQKGNKITVKRMLIIPDSEISPENYTDFKQLYDLWNEENFRKLVFKSID